MNNQQSAPKRKAHKGKKKKKKKKKKSEGLSIPEENQTSNLKPSQPETIPSTASRRRAAEAARSSSTRKQPRSPIPTSSIARDAATSPRSKTVKLERLPLPSGQPVGSGSNQSYPSATLQDTTTRELRQPSHQINAFTLNRSPPKDKVSAMPETSSLPPKVSLTSDFAHLDIHKTPTQPMIKEDGGTLRPPPSRREDRNFKDISKKLVDQLNKIENTENSDADPVTLRCADLIREDILLQKAGIEKMRSSQICYNELDVKALEESVLGMYNLAAVDPERHYHESETKRIWARVLTNIIRAISDAQYLLAYNKLDAMGFWEEVKLTPTVLLSLQRLTRCPLFVGPGDNLRAIVSPSASLRQHVCNQADCNRYIERIQAADSKKAKGKSKKAGNPEFTPDEVDEAEELSPYESASQAGRPDEPESVVDSELTKGSSTLTDRDDPGGKKTTNHVEPDFGLLWEEIVRQYYGCPRCAVTFEAKRWRGSPDKNSSNNSHTQACTYCRIGQAADGCLFGMAVHGLRYRIYQYTGRDELTAWVPDCKKASDLRYRDSYEAFRSNDYMFTIGEDARYPEARNVGLSNLISLIVSITVGLSNRNSRALDLGSPYSVDLSLDKAHGIKISEVSIEAVTPRSAVRGRPVDTGSERDRCGGGDGGGERGLHREEPFLGPPGNDVTMRALEEQVAKDANLGATHQDEKESANIRRVQSWLGSVHLGREPADRKD